MGFLERLISMTKTKKILTILVAAILVAAAIFFAIWGRVAKKFDYADLDYSKYVTFAEGFDLKTIGALTVNIAGLSEPTEEDALAKIADALYKYREKVKDKDGKETSEYVKYTESAIGRFDAAYVYYFGYDKASGEVVTDGSKMESTTLLVPGAGSKHSFALKAVADSLLEKKPVDSKFEKVKPAEGAEDAVVPAGSVVYIDYTWVRYDAAGEKAGNSGDDAYKDLPTESVRVDLANPSSLFPAGFAEQLVGKKIDPKGSVTLDRIEVVEDSVTYEYEYTVTVLFALNDLDDSSESDGWKAFELEYTYDAESEEKDIYGKALAGRTVVFEVVVDYFHNVPEFDAEYSNAAADHKHDESEEDDHMESIFTHNSYLNFDSTAYFADNFLLVEKDWDKVKTYADYAAYRAATITEKELLSSDAWEALTEDEKKHESYDKYLEAKGVLPEQNYTDAVAYASFVSYMTDAYAAYALDTLIEEYENSRMYKAGAVIWKNHILPNVTVTAPERALKLAYEELLDQFEYTYYEGKDSNTKKFYRDTFKDVGAYIEAACKDDMKKYGAEDWKTYLEKVAEENVSHTVLMYYLFESCKDAEGFDFETVYSELYGQYLIYVLYGYISMDQIEQAARFDAVLAYLYELAKANVIWDTTEPPTEETTTP